MACPVGSLPLAYHTQLTPFFFPGIAGNWKGVDYEYWNAVAKLAKCQGINYKYYELLGTGEVYEEIQLKEDIRNGLIFSTIQPLYLFDEDPLFYGYSKPATWYRLMLLEKSARDRAKVASISFFVVFPWDILLLFIASCLIIDFLNYCFKKCRSQREDGQSSKVEILLDASDLIRYALFSFSIVFVVQQWQGYFNGNNLLSIIIDGTPFLTMATQFQEHKRKLVVDSFEPIFDDYLSSQLFGGNSSFIYGTSVKNRFHLVCEESSRVGVFQEYEYIEYLSNEPLNDQCKLTER